MGRSIFDETQVITLKAKIVAADTTTLKTLFGSSAVQARIDNLLLTSNDTIDHKVVIWVTNASINYVVGSVDVPAGAGHGGVAPVDAIPLIVVAGQQGLLVDSTTTYSYSVEVAVTSTFEVDCVGMGGYF